MIRDKVKSGKTKIEVANELGVSYYTVKKHTKDISTILKISVELERQIREEVKKGKSIRQVAEELDISRDTVIKYTRDIFKNPIRKMKRPPELIEKIRENVLKYSSKTKTAKEMGLNYYVVKYHTRDIHVKRFPTDVIAKIRNEVTQGKTKIQVAKEMHLSKNTVTRYTVDINRVEKKADITFKAFLLLQEIVNKGYAFPCPRYTLKEYYILKKKFPRLCRVKMHGRAIFFMEDKSNIAVNAYLLSLHKRITSYQELKQVIKAFEVDIDSDGKNMFLYKKKSKRRDFGKNFEDTSLREKGDSFVESKLFHLLLLW